MTLLRALAVLGLSCTIGCGVIDGVKGPDDEPGTNLGARSWHGAQQIDSSLGGNYPRFALGQGALWGAWWYYDNDAKVSRVQLTRRVGSGSFEAPVTVPTEPGQNGGLIYPQLAVGQTGDPVLVFEGLSDNTAATYSMWGGRLGNGLAITGTEFTRLDSPSSNTPQMSQRQAVGVDDQGNAIFVWGQAGSQWAVTASKTSAFSQQQNLITANTFGGADTQVAVGPNGSALVGLSSGTSTIAIPVDFGGGLFTEGNQHAVTVSTSQNQGAPAVAMRGNHGVAAWRTYGSNGVTVQSYENGAWSSVQSFVDDHISYYYGVEVAVNAQGQKVVLWRETLPTGTDYYTGVLMGAFYDGQSWSTPQAISPVANTHKPWWASVDLNDRGYAIVSWADFESTATYTRIWASRLDLKASAPAFGAPEAIDLDQPGAGLAGTPENVRNITVLMDPAGTSAYVGFIAHEDDANKTSHVYVNWLE